MKTTKSVLASAPGTAPAMAGQVVGQGYPLYSRPKSPQKFTPARGGGSLPLWGETVGADFSGLPVR